MLKNAIAVGEFKAKCLEIVKRVHDEGKSVVLTKRGVPYATVQPIKSDEKPRTIFGCMKGRMEISGDIIAPIDVEWDAQK
jgi:prevent-host-death family protein